VQQRATIGGSVDGRLRIGGAAHARSHARRAAETGEDSRLATFLHATQRLGRPALQVAGCINLDDAHRLSLVISGDEVEHLLDLVERGLRFIGRQIGEQEEVLRAILFRLGAVLLRECWRRKRQHDHDDSGP
jgi:hypothetical protein